MSDFHFGVDDYDLNYYPKEASDGMCGVDWDKVESVEIEYDMYVKERTCHAIAIYNMHDEWCGDECSACGYEWYEDEPNYCPNCGAKVVSA